VKNGRPGSDRAHDGARVRTVLAIFGALWLTNASKPAAAETMQFTITRNGDPIGTHTIEINRAGPETTVNITTDLAVTVLFITAYRLQQRGGERWVTGHLVALNSTTDNNGTHHKVAVMMKGSDLQLNADGKVSRLDKDIVPSSPWNPEFLRHSTVLDTQDGRLSPVSVGDQGLEQLAIRTRTISAHHYAIKSRYSEDVWYDQRGRLVQVKIIGSDGSIILYKPD
jgi:Family of unknown function (DUF6134)